METIKTIGWIGTGVMGASMCKHLLKAGYSLNVYNRSKSKSEELLKLGAKWLNSPREIASSSDIVCVMVGFPKDVEEVVLDKTTGALEGCKPGSILCDFTTSTPSLAKRIAEEAKARNVGTLDCPVSGGDIGAREGRLTIMCGGEKSVFDRMIPIFSTFGKAWNLMGPAGAGQHTKAVNQTVIATNMIGVCEGLLYAQRAGLDPSLVLSAIGGGAASSFSLSSYWPRASSNDYKPGFYVKHFVKDLGIVLDECKIMGIELPGVALAYKLYVSLRDEIEGGGEMGTQALIKVLEKINEKK